MRKILRLINIAAVIGFMIALPVFAALSIRIPGVIIILVILAALIIHAILDEDVNREENIK